MSERMRYGDAAVIIRVGRVVAPAVIRADCGDWQVGLRGLKAIRTEIYLTQIKFADGRRSVAFSLVAGNATATYCASKSAVLATNKPPS